MQTAFVNICDVPTHIFTRGRWIEESLDGIKEIAICITGNPGLPGFYTEFMDELHRELDEKMPVWVIGHMGHDDPPANSIRQVPELEGNETLFNLDGQVRHKIEFIEKYVPANVKIHLIGHSIGAWMILQLLEHKDIRRRIKRCYLLFPTFERMLDSSNGFIFTKIALPLYTVFGFLIALFNRLPHLLRVLLIQMYFWAASIPRVYLDTAVSYSRPTSVAKVIFLAKDEMTRVRSRPDELIEANIPLLRLYYGTTDGWVPVKYFKELKQRFPNIDARLDSHKIAHAFVLRSSQQMAAIVGDMITEP